VLFVFIISLFNLSCLFAITSLIGYTIMKAENNTFSTSLVVCKHAIYYRR